MSTIKGVVLEKHKGFAVALTADGQFKKIIVKGDFELGDEVLGKEFKSRKSLYQRVVGGVAIAAALLIAILMPGILKEDKISPNTIIASSDTAEQTVVAYVQVDINPSLKLGLNENSTVIEATPLNADGEQVIAQGDLTGMSVSSAMELVAERCYKLGYIKEDKENIVNLTYIPKEKKSNKIDKDKLERDIKVKVEKVMDKKKIEAEVKELKEVKENETKPNSNQKSNQNKDLNKQNSETKESSNNNVKNLETKVQNNSNNSNKLEMKNKDKEKSTKNKSNNNDKVIKDQSDNNGLQDNSGKNSNDNSNNSNDNSNNSNKNLKEKTKGISINNELESRFPWYKILELG